MHQASFTCRTATVALLVLAGSLVVSCGRGVSRWNVLLVMVDTLRADHLSAYGYARSTSPALEALGREAILFENAYSQAGCTFPSVNSLLTSRYPAYFKRAPVGRVMPEELPSLQGILKAHGYSTFAVSASSVVRKTPSRHNKVGGYGRHFDTFDEKCFEREAACVNERALATMDEIQEPFFGYLHYLDPHQPYDPPESFEKSFADAYEGGKPFIRRGSIGMIEQMLYKDGPRFKLEPRDMEQLRSLYDDEIAYFDQQLAALIGELRQRGLWERTLLVFASDHGEAFMEHGHIHHCRDLTYNSVVRTPLLLRIPSLVGGVRREGLAQNLDIVPTVLDYLGLARPEQEFQGRSLRPTIERDRAVNRYAFATQGVRRAVTDGRYKLILDLAMESHELFDLKVDPGEQHDLATELPAVSERLRTALNGWLDRYELATTRKESIERAREQREHLRALGYL